MGEAATRLGGMKLSTFYRRVKQVLMLGLTEIVRAETRNGRKVKLYRAVQPEFIVPLEATSSISLASYMDTLLRDCLKTWRDVWS